LSEVSPKGRSLKARALSFLAMREHTRAELAAKLSAFAMSEEHLASTLSELESLGLLSDSRAASALVRSKASRLSKTRIAATLRHKGVNDELVETATEGLDDMATAKAVWEKKFGVLATDGKTLARQVRFLQSRGFGMRAIMSVVKMRPGEDEA
jgi:regulatory protein